MSLTDRLEVYLDRPKNFVRLMNKVCVGMGFCGSVVDGEPRHVVDYFPETGTVSASQFATWVLEAEGMSSKPGEPFWHILQKEFIEHMGHETVNVALLMDQWIGNT